IVIPFQVNEAGETQLWFQKREEDGPLDGYLEWPGGKLEAGESPPAAGVRELKEETGVSIKIEDLTPFQNYSYEYPDRKVTLFTHLLLVRDPSVFAKGWEGFEGKNPLKLKGKVPKANEKILEELGSYFLEMKETGQWSEVWEI
ncbi:MAG: NUDIX domain-containing protein, partial [Halobacteriovoraceae bacterium]|nr:NUDIX domain-containing protein [Halobacteriovoraceae bacterium]